MESGRGQVVGGAGLHRAGVHREPGVIHHHLHVAPERLPLARVPQVAARVRVALSDPVGADQGPVQADERLFRSAQPVQDLGKVRGPVGDHPQGLMQIPVGRGPAHLRVAGQGGQGGARHHPPQQEHGPGPGRWPPSATASRHGPCGGRPTTGRWCGRWTREHREWQDRTARGDPLVVTSIGQNTLSRAAPARTTPTPRPILPAPPRRSPPVQGPSW